MGGLAVGVGVVEGGEGFVSHLRLQVLEQLKERWQDAMLTSCGGHTFQLLPQLLKHSSATMNASSCVIHPLECS